MVKRCQRYTVFDFLRTDRQFLLVINWFWVGSQCISLLSVWIAAHWSQPETGKNRREVWILCGWVSWLKRMERNQKSRLRTWSLMNQTCKKNHRQTWAKKRERNERTDEHWWCFRDHLQEWAFAAHPVKCCREPSNKSVTSCRKISTSLWLHKGSYPIYIYSTSEEYVVHDIWLYVTICNI